MRTNAVLLVGLLSCGTIEPDPIIEAPRNVCSSTPCAEGSTCNSRGFCEVDEDDVDFALVFPMPDTAYNAPNVTYLLTQNDLAQVTSTAPDCLGRCVNVPRITVFKSRYFVTGEASRLLGATLTAADGTEIAPDAVRQLPIRTTYTPQLVVDGVAFDATDVGLPLGKVLANTTVDETALPDQGIGQTTPVYTAAILPPGTYRVEYQVDPSLQSFAPPRSERIEVPRSQFTQTDDRPFTVTTPDPEAPRTTAIKSRYRKLDGFQAYLVDAGSGRRISRSVGLGSSQNPVVHLATVNQDDGGQLPGSVDFVLAPPPNSYAPTLQTHVIGGRLLAPEYPELPPPAIVEGTVTGPDGGVRTDLELVSSDIVLLRNEGLQGDQLHYRTRVSTDGDGRFSTIVPEGTYRVYADPDVMVSVGRRETRLATKGTEPGALFGVRTTWNVQLGPKSVVTGQAVLEDSRSLGGVGVSFTPSIYRWEGSRFELPRPVRVTTNGRGQFTANLDPGFYDLTITPTSGTGFAPFVRTDFFVPQRLEGSCTLALGPLAVKVPKVYEVTLRDASNNVIPLSWARVFARSAGSQHYVEIQHQLLDANGTGQLLFRKPEHAVLKGCD